MSFNDLGHFYHYERPFHPLAKIVGAFMFGSVFLILPVLCMTIHERAPSENLMVFILFPIVGLMCLYVTFARQVARVNPVSREVDTGYELWSYRLPIGKEGVVAKEGSAFVKIRRFYGTMRYGGRSVNNMWSIALPIEGTPRAMYILDYYTREEAIAKCAEIAALLNLPFDPSTVETE